MLEPADPVVLDRLTKDAKAYRRELVEKLGPTPGIVVIPLLRFRAPEGEERQTASIVLELLACERVPVGPPTVLLFVSSDAAFEACRMWLHTWYCQQVEE